jgi:hypothetical protein
MRIIITENQLNRMISQANLLNEETQGVEEFIDALTGAYPDLEQHRELIGKIIEHSGCPKIEFASMKFASGLALSIGVLISRHVLRGSKEQALFIIFHELAHQHQFKKYGAEKMYELYSGDISLPDAVKFLRYTENVADQFGMRKCRELAKNGILDTSKIITKGGYDNYNDKAFEAQIVTIAKKVKEANLTSPEQISEMMYNWIKNMD